MEWDGMGCLAGYSGTAVQRHHAYYCRDTWLWLPPLLPLQFRTILYRRVLFQALIALSTVCLVSSSLIHHHHHHHPSSVQLLRNLVRHGPLCFAIVKAQWGRWYGSQKLSTAARHR